MVGKVGSMKQNSNFVEDESDMNFGIYLPNFGPYGNAATLASLARDAENAGWDGFFLWDHIAGYPLDMVDSWVALTAVSLNTSKIRIGTTVTPLPRRRPWKLAREAVSLDHLSNGRLILSVGIGLGEAEWDHLDEETNLKARGQMLDEALTIVDGLWQGEPFSFSGEHYNIQDVHFLPKPKQNPRIPIWVGGFWPNKRPFLRAAQWEGMFPLFQTHEPKEELEQLAAAVDFVHSQRETEEGFDVVMTGFTDGDDGIDKIRPYQDAGVTWWLECIAPFRYGVGFEERWPVEKLRERILQGPPGR